MACTYPTRALSILHEAGYEASYLVYDYELHGGTGDAAAKLGISEHAIVKSLVFDNGRDGDERQAVMVLMHGDERVSMRKLQRAAGIHRLLPAAPKVALALTGYEPGGICPFGLKTPLPVFMQETLVSLPMLYINAGARGIVAAIPPEALRIVHPIVANLASEKAYRIF